MSRWTDATVVGSCYADDALPWSHQETINYLLVKAEARGTRSASKLRGVPGMVKFSQLDNAPIRGMHDVEGLLLVVCGRTLYSVDTKGNSTSIGTIPGVARVSMAHNQITGGNEVAIANGQSGYVYNTVTGQLTQISDDAFPGAISFDYVDSYITGIEPGRRFAYISDLANATSYSTLDYYEAEGSPDALVGQIVTHREWWLFGTRTIEPYINTGAATGTFQRQAGMVIERGAASTFGIANLDNSPFWVGDDGIVYRANGYTPQRISTMPVEQALSACNLAQCFAFTFEDQGHKVFYITCPDGKTFGYDVASGEWHRRKSDGMDRWRINALVKSNGKWVAGDYANGKLYVLDWATQDEDGAILERRRITGVLNDAQNNVIVNGVELVIDTGVRDESKVFSGTPTDHLAISGTLPQGLVNGTADFTYVTSGGTAPRVVSLQDGALPTGLSIDSGGHVTGTYTAYGTFSWVTQVQDAAGSIATVSQTMTVFAKVIADVDFNTGSLTYDKVGRTWTVDSAVIKDKFGNQPVTMPAAVSSPSVSGMAMSLTPDTNTTGTYDYQGTENVGIESPLGADAIGAGVDFCVELDARLNLYSDANNNSRTFLCIETFGERMTFGARLGATVPMENTIMPLGLTQTLWAPPILARGAYFHFAVTRAGDVLSCWYNGARYAQYTGASTLNITSASRMVVGNGLGNSSTTVGWPGQVDNVYAIRGWAKYA